MKNPPVLVAVLGFFGALAGFGFLFMGFRMLGFDWFGLFGDLPRFESVGLWGWLAVITGFALLNQAMYESGGRDWFRMRSDKPPIFLDFLVNDYHEMSSYARVAWERPYDAKLARWLHPNRSQSGVELSHVRSRARSDLLPSRAILMA